METPAQHCGRVVTALEDLVAQETTALANRDFSAILALQERTAPLVDFLVGTARQPEMGPTLRTRITALRDLRDRNGDSLAGEIERTRAELQRLEVTRRLVAQIGPIYGQLPEVGGQVQATG